MGFCVTINTMESIVPQLIINSIVAGAIYSLVALGFNLVYSTTRFFNLAHGVLCTIGGYVAYFITTSIGWGIVPAIFVAIISTGLISFLIDRFVYAELRKRKATSMVLLVASLGIMTALQAIIAILFTSQFKTLNTGVETKVYEFWGGIMTDVQLVTLILTVVIMVVLGLVFSYTRFGKTVRAVSDEEGVARIVGIDTEKVISKIFIIGGMVAGLAGVMVGLDTGIEPTMGMGLLLKGVIASIIGGVGSIYGGVVGAFVLGFIENFGIWKISGEWKDAIAFGVLILFLLFRPHGILGSVGKK